MFFLAGKMGVNDALQLAVLAADTQQAIFDEECTNWETDKYFSMSRIRYLFDRYKCQLGSSAPFDVNDITLVPERGACTKCPFNTATLRSLFPDENTEGRCTDKSCFEKKCFGHLSNKLSAMLAEHQPHALLFAGTPDNYMQTAVAEHPGAAGLPVYDYYRVYNAHAPGTPNKKDYTCPKETKRGTRDVHDPEAYAEALQEYEQDKAAFDLRVQSGKILKGLYISRGRYEVILFDIEKRVGSSGSSNSVSLKSVNDAIKAKTATPELLQAGIDRIAERELSSQRGDREKNQERVHELTIEKIATPDDLVLTPAHKAATRLLLLKSFDWNNKNRVWTTLFSNNEADEPETLFNAVLNLNEAQTAWLIGQALACKSDSKSPDTIEGYFLRQLAIAAGVDVAAVDADTEAKAKERQEKNKTKILFFEHKKGMLESKEAKQ